jgi:hypothetical protein
MDDDFKFLRHPEGEKPALPDGETIDLGDLGDFKIKEQALVIDLPDGSISINLGGISPATDEESKDHDANLALHVNEGELANIAEELIRLITDDITRQEKRLQDISKGLDLLGVELIEPKSEPNDEGLSVVKHPLLLEAVLRFQANARGEMLPADGPVKVANEGDNTKQLDEQAKQLEDDLNFYLTSGAPEYYPDFDRMLFSLGLGGEAYRKVYWHPIKRRPVVETIDRKDIVLSDGAVSLEACGRVTHRSRMRPSIVKQMQLVGAWKDVPLGMGVYSPDQNVVDRKLDQITGVQAKTSVSSLGEQDREIYECYCELDLNGFEHTEDGEKTGLPLPYRVTIDKDSRQILEIRRWWQEGDENYVRKEVFTEYVFVPAMPGTNFGLLHILGNASRALTAAWRITLDAGMLGNFPGGIMARSTGRQQTTNIRVGPGQVAPMDVEGVPLNQAFMPLPYKGVDAGFVAIIQNVEQTAQRVGMISETNVGEGRSDAPVGTTIALIEQATKVLNAVHKRMHVAQSKEFQLLKELFLRDPQSLWRSNKNPKFQQDAQKLQEALENKNIVPRADPNTSSQTMRIQKAIAVYTLAQQNPQAFDQRAVYARILSMIGIDDAEELFTKAPPTAPQQDESKMLSAKAAVMNAQAKMLDTSIKAQQAQGDMSLKAAQLQTQNIEAATKRKIAQTDAQNHRADREGKIELEKLKLDQTRIVHRDKLLHDQQNKGLDLERAMREKVADLTHERQQSALDMEHDHIQNAMQIAKDRNEAQAQRAHDLQLAREQAMMNNLAQSSESEGE